MARFPLQPNTHRTRPSHSADGKTKVTNMDQHLNQKRLKELESSG